MDTERFQDTAEHMLQVLLDFYSPYFTATRDFTLSDIRLNALTEYHNREEKSLLGMKLKRPGPEANEYGLYWLTENFTAEALEQAKGLLDSAEKELVKPHADHGFTMLSMIVLTGQVFEGAAVALKKYRLWKTYHRQGIATARFVVIDVSDRSILCNKDGKDLKNLLEKALSGKTLF